jgi:hypothetical protein
MQNVLKIDLARINPQGSESQRVGQILHAIGWTKRRASDCSRVWEWARPAAEPEVTTESDDAIPF